MLPLSIYPRPMVRTKNYNMNYKVNDLKVLCSYV